MAPVQVHVKMFDEPITVDEAEIPHLQGENIFVRLADEPAKPDGGTNPDGGQGKTDAGSGSEGGSPGADGDGAASTGRKRATQ